MLNEVWNLSLSDYKFLFVYVQWDNFINENTLLFDDLSEDWDLSMASDFYDSLFNVWLDKMTFLYDYLFGDLFIDGLLNLDGYGLWFLTVTVFGEINWFLN
jgi:hypothetical protein